MHFLTKCWPLLKRILTLAFVVLVLWLLLNYAQKIAWREVKQVLGSYSLPNILVGAGLGFGAYLAYSSYDLLGRYYVKHGISKRRTMMIAFICCAFTLNLGALIGSVGFRYRMYSQQGVSKGDITHIVGLSLATNWLGYILLSGLVFVTGSVVIPFDWALNGLPLRILGALFLTSVFAYFAFCRFSKRRTWTFQNQVITLPSFNIAVGQLAVASAHWLLMCGVIFSFLYTEISYFSLLGVLLISAIAGVLAHIPSAFGVLEAVFIALLGDQLASAILIAALIAYRAVFYLLPLSLALVFYVLIEVAANGTQDKPRQR